MRPALMSRLFPALAALCLSAMAGVAVAQTLPLPKKPVENKEIVPEEERKPQTLDDLYRRLANAKDENEATGIARLIERRLARSDSPTAELLMRRATIAGQRDNNALTVEILDRIVTLEPKWAEAWARRAVAFEKLDDPFAALADLRNTVMLEPRHYRAWQMLGHIFLQNEDDKRALTAFRKALANHPFLEGVQKAVEKLQRKIDGTAL